MHRDWHLSPWDHHNQELAAQAHPEPWHSKPPTQPFNLVAIGGGTAGIISALGTSGLGGTSALVERKLLGGDCLNFGCVPSKALISAANAIHSARKVADWGGTGGEHIAANFAAVMERLRSLRARISHHDSATRFASLGVEVFFGEAQFTSPTSLAVAGQSLHFRKAVIATGGRAAVPPVSGLEETGYLTNETLFSLTELPLRLVVLGGGPIGCELAQAFARQGSQVTLVQAGDEILSKEDPEAAAVIRQSLEQDGIQVLLSARAASASKTTHGRTINVEHSGQMLEIHADVILVAAGRIPNLQGLNLEAAQVTYSPRGVDTNDYLQTTNPRIYAAGDITGRWQFTHAADAMARACIQNALFMGRSKVSQLIVPRTTYTFPELAHVGLTPQEAETQGIPLSTHRAELACVDRALLEGHPQGFAKIHTKRGTAQVVGATVVAPHAGEMIGEITLLMKQRAPLSQLASTIHCYPTQAEVLKRAADAYQKTRLTPFVASLFKRWLSWQRS